MGEAEYDLLPCWLHLLEAASTAPDMKDETLAHLASLAPRTVRTYFQRMFDVTGIHDRGVLVMTAVRRGWIPPRDSLMRRSDRVVRGRLDGIFPF